MGAVLPLWLVLTLEDVCCFNLLNVVVAGCCMLVIVLLAAASVVVVVLLFHWGELRTAIFTDSGSACPLSRSNLLSSNSPCENVSSTLFMLNVGLSSFVRYLIDVVPTGIVFFDRLLRSSWRPWQSFESQQSHSRLSCSHGNWESIAQLSIDLKAIVCLMLSANCCCWSWTYVDQDVPQVCGKLYPFVCFFCCVCCCYKICSSDDGCWIFWVLK